MIPAESSSSDCHTQEDGDSIRHRVQTCQIGWRVPSELVCQVQECCRREGLRPGEYLTRALRAYLGQPMDLAAVCERCFDLHPELQGHLS
jgi:hypothetical protein